MCNSNPNMPKLAAAATKGGTPYVNPLAQAPAVAQAPQPVRAQPTFQGYMPQGYNPMQGWGGSYGNPAGQMETQWTPRQGSVQAGPTSGVTVQQPQRQQTAPAAEAAAVPYATTQAGAGKVPRVRTEIVTGGKDVYRKALASELNKSGNLKKGVGVI